MDLSKILTISGKSGLYKIVSQTKNGLVVESFSDGRKVPVFLSDRSSILEDITLFTTTKDLPLKEIFLKIYEKQGGKSSISPKEDPAKLTAFFESIVPDYDKNRVYVSDIKKVLSWYNILLEEGFITIEEPEIQENMKERSQGKETSAKENKAGTDQGLKK